MIRRRLLSRLPAAPALQVEAAYCAAFALVVRLIVVVLSAGRFPPAEDGRFYHVVASRIAQGDGYTWQWPDGVVTYAAHYPVGYPALVGLLYSVFGPHPWAAMLLNAVLGALAVYWLFRVVAVSGSRRAARYAAVALAVQPTLVAYTAALMTEGVAAALTVGACWLAVPQPGGARRGWRFAALAALLGVCVLVRPQLLLLAPGLGWLHARWQGHSQVRALAGAALLSAGCLVVVAPWTVRNCYRMERCVLVSANKGWNLLIGTAVEGEGRWIAIEEVGVPPECRTVYGEADKDECFSRVALARIAAAPSEWLSLIPLKLTATFDEVGAPGWYFATSSSGFTESRRQLLAIIEAAAQRGSLLVGLLVLAVRSRVRRLPRLALAAVGVLVIWPAAWLSAVLLVALAWARGGWRIPALGAAGLVILTTAATHAIFFGAARYGMVVLPWLLAIPFAAWSMDESTLGGGESGAAPTG